MTNKMMDNLINLPFQNADPHYWTNGVAHLLLAIVLISTPWKKIYQILLLRNYVYLFVDLEIKIKNTTINIDYSLYLPNYSVTHMSIPMGLLIPPSLTLYNDNPMSLSMV